jgi:RsiW-degrading membrane proteinase PrsW (M82 family)
MRAHFHPEENEMPLIGAIFFGFVPALFFAWFIYWLDRYEKEPKILIGAAFVWGFLVAAGGAFIINTVLGLGIYVITGSESATDLTTAAVIAPLVEESLKGLAVLIVFFLFYKEFDSVLDGMIYAGVAALGFAATENAFYIFDKGFNQNGWQGFWMLVFVRVILVGWQHPFYTSFTGIGLAVSRMNRNPLVKFLAPVLGWMTAVFAHAFHNTVASLSTGLGGLALGTLLDWSGWFLMFLFAIWMIRREGQLLPKHLAEEVAAGRMTPSQLQKAASPFGSMFALLNGRATARFYQVCGELAHKKEQYSLLGDEGGNLAAIESLRRELAMLSPQVRA